HIELEPLPEARVCVNGSPVVHRLRLKHGDRLLWGHHHFFRINCPRTTAGEDEMTSSMGKEALDYHFAKEELEMKELSDDPIQVALAELERQHAAEKQAALEEQRREHEYEMNRLRQYLPPGMEEWAKSAGGGLDRNSARETHGKVRRKSSEADFRRCLRQLRETLPTLKSMVREANSIAQEMGRDTRYSITLQIPRSSLSPGPSRQVYQSEAAVLVKRLGLPHQVWSAEQLENRLIEMREAYHARQSGEEVQDDPFYDVEQRHELIGELTGTG
ncbi:unnamed protein product, partial [Cyprideis torosa]